MEETKEEKIELKSITADGESPPTTKVRSHLLPGAETAIPGGKRAHPLEMRENGKKETQWKKAHEDGAGTLRM